jgi:hypothetical protein
MFINYFPFCLEWSGSSTPFSKENPPLTRMLLEKIQSIDLVTLDHLQRNGTGAITILNPSNVLPTSTDIFALVHASCQMCLANAANLLCENLFNILQSKGSLLTSALLLSNHPHLEYPTLMREFLCHHKKHGIGFISFVIDSFLGRGIHFLGEYFVLLYSRPRMIFLLAFCDDS